VEARGRAIFRMEAWFIGGDANSKLLKAEAKVMDEKN
jgi:hypothetical protein